MADRFKSIKAQLDAKSDDLNREEERIRKGIASLLSGYQNIAAILGSEDADIEKAKKIAEAYAKFDFNNLFDRPV